MNHAGSLNLIILMRSIFKLGLQIGLVMSVSVLIHKIGFEYIHLASWKYPNVMESTYSLKLGLLECKACAVVNPIHAFIR